MTREEITLAMAGEGFITCGRCGKPASFERWTTSRLGLELPRGVYQCPHCRHSFRRVCAVDDQGRSVVRCVESEAVL